MLHSYLELHIKPDLLVGEEGNNFALVRIIHIQNK